METLTSVRNPLVKEIRKAIQRGSLTEHGLCVAESFHLLDEAVRSGCHIESVVAAESARANVEEHLKKVRGIRILALPDALFHSIAATEASQGVMALVKPPAWTLDQLFAGQSLVIVLDGVQDPGNAGAIIRAAEAFRATGVGFLKGSVNPYNPKALRASAGSVFRVPLIAGLDEALLLAAVEERKVELFAMMPNGSVMLDHCHLERKCAVVIGGEGHGVSERILQKSIDARIPTTGVESLNAAMAASIVIYEARKQRIREGS